MAMDPQTSTGADSTPVPSDALSGLGSSFQNAADQISPPASPSPSPSTDGVPQPAGPGSPNPAPASTPAATNGIPPGTPHGRLLSIIQGMAVGLDSFGKAIATHGKEGGATEVTQQLAQKQQLDLQKQQADREKSESDVRVKSIQADTLMKQAQTHMLVEKGPIELQTLYMQNQEAWMSFLTNTLHISPLFAMQMIPGQGTADHVNAVGSAANSALPDHGLVGTALVSHQPTYGKGDGQTMGFSFDKLSQTTIPQEQFAPVLASSQRQVDYASKVLGSNDPTVQAAQSKLDLMKKAPTINARDAYILDNQLLAGVSQAVVANQHLIEHQKAEADASKAQTGAAEDALALKQFAASGAASKGQTFDTWQAGQKAQIEQTIKDGDPKAMAPMLVSGAVAPSQIISTRNAAWASNVMKAADVYSMQTTGQHFKPEVAEDWFKKSHDPGVIQTLDMVQAMHEKGGSIDIANKNFQSVPLKIDSQTFNKIMNGTMEEFGGKNVVGFKTSMLGLADEYSKVMGGGQPSDTGRQQALDVLKEAYSKGQGATAVKTMRQDIDARAHAMVGDNPTLKSLYPQLSNINPAQNVDPAAKYGGITRNQ